MSEERLQEIKDSVNFQREILLAHNMGTLCVDEEQELIEEIERLNNIANKLDKLIEQYSKNDYYYKYNGKYLKSEIINDLKELKGSDKE